MNLLRPDWSTGNKVSKPVNVEVLQEMVDLLFGPNAAHYLSDSDFFEMKRRNWASRLDVVPATQSAATGGVTWQSFLSEQTKAGLTRDQISEAWKARKAAA